MKIFTYIMTDDRGFAPNPYFGLCTLACCKPKIRREVAKCIFENFYIKFKSEKGCKRLTIKNNIDSLQGIKDYCNNGKLKGYNDFSEFIKSLEIYVVGIVGSRLKTNAVEEGSILYIMQVTDIEDFFEYWKNEKYSDKKPDEQYFVKSDNGSYSYKDCGDNIYELYRDMPTITIHPSFHYFQGEDIVDRIVHDLSGKYVLISRNFVYYGVNATNEYKGKLHSGIGHSVLKDNHRLEQFVSQELKKYDKRILGQPINSDANFYWEE